MNKLKFSLLALVASIGTSVMGASIDHIQNYSAEYGANPAQQGAINTGSSVYFNPAGIVRLEDGIYFVGGVQYAFGEQEMTTDHDSHPTNLSSPIPNFALYKKSGDTAYFWTIGGVGGGASLHYKNSIPLPMNLGPLNINGNDLFSHAELKGSNLYSQTTIGTSYSLTNKWSASVAVRGVYAIRDLKANVITTEEVRKLNNLPLPFIPHIPDGTSLDSKRKATGFGFQLGLNYAPTEKLNIGLRYDSKVKLDFKTKSDYDKGLISKMLLGEYPMYIDGMKTRRDLPALLALGASYKVTDNWTTFIGGNYYFNKDATMDKITGDVVDDINGTYKNINYDIQYKDGWEISLGSEYWFTNQIAWLVGVNFADTGAPAEGFSATEYALNSTMIGTGIKYRPNPDMEWVVAFNHYIYDSKTFENVKYEKEISSLGLNFVKRF